MLEKFINNINKRNNQELTAVILLLLLFQYDSSPIVASFCLTVPALILLFFGYVKWHGNDMNESWISEYRKQILLSKSAIIWYVLPLGYSLYLSGGLSNIATSVFVLILGVFVIAFNYKVGIDLEKALSSLTNANQSKI